MPIKLDSGQFDLVGDAVETVLRKIGEGVISSDEAYSKLFGLLEAAITDDPEFMSYVKAESDA